MVRLRVVVWVTPPPVPVMVIVRVPAVACAPTLIVTVELPAPGAAIAVGLKVTVTPLPSPDALRVTAESKLPEIVVVTLACPAAPGATVTEVGFTLIAKLPVWGGGARVLISAEPFILPQPVARS
jgi:hypothetical protein